MSDLHSKVEEHLTNTLSNLLNQNQSRGTTGGAFGSGIATMSQMEMSDSQNVTNAVKDTVQIASTKIVNSFTQETSFCVPITINAQNNKGNVNVEQIAQQTLEVHVQNMALTAFASIDNEMVQNLLENQQGQGQALLNGSKMGKIIMIVMIVLGAILGIGLIAVIWKAIASSKKKQTPTYPILNSNSTTSQQTIPQQQPLQIPPQQRIPQQQPSRSHSSKDPTADPAKLTYCTSRIYSTAQTFKSLSGAAIKCSFAGFSTSNSRIV